jgi:hypothetical protein
MTSTEPRRLLHLDATLPTDPACHLTAVVEAADLPALKDAALAAGVRLWGEGKHVVHVEGPSWIHTKPGGRLFVAEFDVYKVIPGPHAAVAA